MLDWSKFFFGHKYQKRLPPGYFVAWKKKMDALPIQAAHATIPKSLPKGVCIRPLPGASWRCACRYASEIAPWLATPWGKGGDWATKRWNDLVVLMGAKANPMSITSNEVPESGTIQLSASSRGISKPLFNVAFILTYVDPVGLWLRKTRGTLWLGSDDQPVRNRWLT